QGHPIWGAQGRKHRNLSPGVVASSNDHGPDTETRQEGKPGHESYQNRGPYFRGHRPEPLRQAQSEVEQAPTPERRGEHVEIVRTDGSSTNFQGCRAMAGKAERQEQANA